jgi:hypothetical protein
MNPRGSIVMPSRPVQIGNATTTGRNPGVIVYVRAGNGKQHREFTRYLAYLGAHAFPVGDELADGRADAYEVIGTVETLERVIQNPYVREWHYIMNVRPPRLGGTVARDGLTGVVQSPTPRIPADASASVRDMLQTQRMGQGDRMAKGETERRAAYPAYRDEAECTDATRLERAIAAL